VKTVRQTFLLGILIMSLSPLFAWGFEPHRRINQQACLILPNSLYSFYKKHLPYMMDHATDADMRRYIDTLEAGKHFIDLEHFGNHIDSLPQTYAEALEKFGSETLNKEGNLPWNIIKKVYQLKSAFSVGDVDQILKLSANLGHYIADAHVPLHTTSNYNGQLSGQTGIHALWETQIPKLFIDTLMVPIPKYEISENWIAKIFQIVQKSHDMVDNLLRCDLEVKNELNPALWYAFEQNKKSVVRTFSPEYVRLLHKKLRHSVEERFLESSQVLAQLIHLSWVMAGQPQLPVTGTLTEEKDPNLQDFDLSCEH
jgi:hypothetical protein